MLSTITLRRLSVRTVATSSRQVGAPLFLRRQCKGGVPKSYLYSCRPLSSAPSAATEPQQNKSDSDGKKVKKEAKPAGYVNAKPLADLLGREPEAGPSVVLYQNHQKWKVRSLGAFAMAQGSYWAFVAYDAAGRWWRGPIPDAADGQVDATTSAAALAGDASSLVDPALAMGFVSHPAWAAFGATFAFSLFGIVHLVSSHLIAQVAVPRDKGAGYLEVITHDYMGLPGRPRVWRAAEMAVHGRYLEPSSKDSFVGILAPGYKARFLLETDMGQFAPRLQVTDSEGQFVRGSTLAKLVQEARISVDEPQAQGFQPLAPLKSSIIDRFEKNDKQRSRTKKKKRKGR
jgi:hypothetical protein